MLMFREGKINSRTFWGYQHKQRFAYPQCPITLVVFTHCGDFKEHYPRFWRGSGRQCDLEVTEFYCLSIAPLLLYRNSDINFVSWTALKFTTIKLHHTVPLIHVLTKSSLEFLWHSCRRTETNWWLCKALYLSYLLRISGEYSCLLHSPFLAYFSLFFFWNVRSRR